MDWRRMRRSENVEDRRGRRAFGGRAGLGFGGLIVVLVLSWLMGVNPVYLVDMLQEGGNGPSSQVQTGPPANDRQTDFVRAILGDTEDTWSTIFQRSDQAYEAPKLVLFNDAVQSACGFARAAVGPFYCSRDEEVYLDLSFFEELSQRFGAPGDFARAYVIAHEVGHHIQHLLGISAKVQAQRARADEVTSNALSVRQELQADCFAGVWGHYTAKRGLIDQTDIAAALHAAAQIGDDRLQKRAQGYVVPEAFTHGSAAQRVQWFKKGLESGDPKQCNTFAAGTAGQL
jgi:predicted metalloprotease